MKELLKFEKEIGESQAKVGGALVVENSLIVAEVKVSFPVAKLVEPATKAVDNLLDKLEKAIPGDWDKVLIEKVKAEYKEELTKLISEV